MKNIAIIGSGSWGVALAIHLVKQGNKVKIWSYLEEERDLINNEHKCKFLPDVVLPEGISCFTTFKEVIEESDFILHVTPSKVTREVVKQYKDLVGNKPIIICTKGFEKTSLKTLDEVVLEEIPNAKVGVLSGPSHAEEVSIGSHTLLVCASKYPEITKEIQDTFMSETMRIYTSTDVKGVELGGALKNIIAFCAGVTYGIGMGDNAFAALITRGLSEIARLGIAIGGQKETFYGLSGLGDLIVTCMSDHSRNRRAGVLIGKGKNIQETKKEVGMVIESLDNIEVAYQLGKMYSIDIPIINTVYSVINNNLDPKDALKVLMNREKKCED